MELLPSGPQWKSRIVTLPGYHTKDPVVLYYRDPIECIEFLLKNPLFSGQIEYQPWQDFDFSGGHIYGEWVTSDSAWEYQVHISLSLCQGKYLSETPLGSPATIRHSSWRDSFVRQDQTQRDDRRSCRPCHDHQLGKTRFIRSAKKFVTSNITPRTRKSIY